MEKSQVAVDLDIILSREDSTLVPWRVIEDRSTYPLEMSNEWADYLMMFETDTWHIPMRSVEIGAVIQIKGHATVEYSTINNENDVAIVWGSSTKFLLMEEYTA